MDYEEFSSHYHQAMKEAQEKFKPIFSSPIVDCGMCEEVEKFIFNKDYVTHIDSETMKMLQNIGND